MNRFRAVLAIAFLLFVAGLVVACSVGFDVDQDETFSCSVDDDCLRGFTCIASRCKETSTGPSTTCVDDDQDGYGANEDDSERQDCPKCENPDPVCQENGTCCARDSLDSDPDIHPNAPEKCDGIDNDSDEEVDEPSRCSTTGDCPTPPENTLFSCQNPNTQDPCTGGTDCVCVLKPALQTSPACREPLACVGGNWEDVPAECL